MSAPPVTPSWPDPAFWQRLDELEDRHQELNAAHERARRGLEQLDRRETEEVRRAWRHYCQVIAELDQTTAEFESLRS